MEPKSVVSVLASGRLPALHSKQLKRNPLGTRPRANPYSSDSEGSSFNNSSSDSETSENESVILSGKQASLLQETSQISDRSTKDAASQSTSFEFANKMYVCSHAGCGKSYRKPSRLREHERVHTGERPFVCCECGKSYIRDSHLRAHSRSHLPVSARPFICTYEIVAADIPKSELIPTQHTAQKDSVTTAQPEACGQRFWTAQHLRAHELAIHHGEKQYKCMSCSLAFSKHGALRLHIAESHSPPGTKPYRCEHPGCTQSFATNQKLQTHVKVHDVTRYACAHPDCSNSTTSTTTQFSTWSLLQEHMRSVHPPMCPYPACNGRTFTSSKGLRGHIKTHRDRELEAGYAADSSTVSHKRAHTETDPVNEGSEPPPKRRRGGEVGRDWSCPISDCDKSFKSKKAQQDHFRVTHEGLRRFACPKNGCNKMFGYKHVMQRHLERHHRPQEDESTSSQPTSTDQEKDTGTSRIIALITGRDYDEPPQKARAARPRTINCPWPDVFEVGKPSDNHTSQIPEIHPKCAFKFSRAYDLRRHLRSVHGLDVNADEASAWVLQHKCK
ncbi:unnamed protein product [Rhizoctonia solani]|uniref:C2H2-type domain-containing protein n=1 Tax=Rhizoctonia solani TaxID=456999 RepID=A0A8H3A957_9AGAM|nr:unnamed protein product [Rhizoctonia solani]CAE6475448.1 unnamed protein product [Rhizoctonia solani]